MRFRIQNTALNYIKIRLGDLCYVIQRNIHGVKYEIITNLACASPVLGDPQSWSLDTPPCRFWAGPSTCIAWSSNVGCMTYSFYGFLIDKIKYVNTEITDLIKTVWEKSKISSSGSINFFSANTAKNKDVQISVQKWLLKCAKILELGETSLYFFNNKCCVRNNERNGPKFLLTELLWIRMWIKFRSRS